MCNLDHGIGDEAGDGRNAVLQRGWVRRDFRVHQRRAAVVEQVYPSGAELLCARAAIGHAAAPPMSVMKSRRFIPILPLSVAVIQGTA